jgi:hypothetical protein
MLQLGTIDNHGGMGLLQKDRKIIQDLISTLSKTIVLMEIIIFTKVK